MKKSIRMTLVSAAALMLTAATVAPIAAYAQTPANPCSAQKTMAKTPRHVAASAHVKAIQEALNKAGAALKADGKMGKETRAALKKFQSEHGLKATGYANKATLKALDVK